MCCKSCKTCNCSHTCLLTRRVEVHAVFRYRYRFASQRFLPHLNRIVKLNRLNWTIVSLVSQPQLTLVSPKKVPNRSKWVLWVVFPVICCISNENWNIFSECFSYQVQWFLARHLIPIYVQLTFFVLRIFPPLQYRWKNETVLLHQIVPCHTWLLSLFEKTAYYTKSHLSIYDEIKLIRNHFCYV